MKVVMLFFKVTLSCLAITIFGFPLSALNSSIMAMTSWKALCPKFTASNIFSSDSSFASDSTIKTEVVVPATIRSRVLPLSSSLLGFKTNSLLINPTLEAATAISNGASEIDKAAEAPIKAGISGLQVGS